MREWAVCLVHYPVLDKAGTVVTTSITNLDVHDIARSSFTYGASRYFLVHPILAQRQLIDEIRGHWTDGSGAKRIPDRKAPMEIVETIESIEAAKRALGADTEVWVTSAKPIDGAISHAEGARLLAAEGPPVLLVFGTGWGLAADAIQGADRALLPIVSPRADGYNHLSVRAAVAILIDRLSSASEG